MCLAIVQGKSMEPTLSDGDIVLVSRWGYHPEYNDIVVTSKNNPLGVCLIKRVAFVGEGDYTNGMNLYVPDGSVFLMGDNVDYSKDSREIGAVLESSLMGKVVMRVYPFDKICVI
jgi:signal peptidase I